MREIKRLTKIRRKKPEELFSGTIQGVITSNGLFAMANRKDHRWAVMYFSVKMDEPIEGIPEEITVHTNGVLNFRKGDTVKIIGKIIRNPLEHFPDADGSIQMNAEHVYNETLKCGF